MTNNKANNNCKNRTDCKPLMGNGTDANSRIDTQMSLTEHFRLIEFTRSGTATRHRIANEPTLLYVQRLQRLCAQTLEPLRQRFGAIRVTSGYRCPQLNKLVGGAPGSQHTMGEAADIHTGGKETSEKMFAYLRDLLPYDQLILEHRPGVYWIHVSLRSDRPGNRHEAFTIDKR